MKQEMDTGPTLKVIFGRLIVWLFGVLIGFVVGLDAGRENHRPGNRSPDEIQTACLKGSDASP